MALPGPEPENMRLSADQANIIKQEVVRHLWPWAAVWVFGSRLNDQARGGDIDLYVETASPVLLDELRCKVSLEEKLSMPVDLLVRAFEDDSPIARIAIGEGKRLD